MTSQKTRTRISVIVFILVLVIWCQCAASKTTQNKKLRSKRHVADMLITESVSRAKRGHNRNLLLSRLLHLADSATGGRCRCFLRPRPKEKCECNQSVLYLRMIHKIMNPNFKLGWGSNADKLNQLLARMKPKIKSMVLKVALNEFYRLTREVEVERTRRGRIMRLHRRKGRKLRNHPRAAFDGMQSMSF